MYAPTVPEFGVVNKGFSFEVHRKPYVERVKTEPSIE
jgi:hypothetical protein